MPPDTPSTESRRHFMGHAAGGAAGIAGAMAFGTAGTEAQVVGAVTIDELVALHGREIARLLTAAGLEPETPTVPNPTPSPTPQPGWTLVEELHPESGESFGDWQVSRQARGTGDILVQDWGGDIGRAIRFQSRGGAERMELHMGDNFPYGTLVRQTSELFMPKPLNPQRWSAGSGEMVTEQSHINDSDPGSQSGYSPSSALRDWRESDETWSVATKNRQSRIQRFDRIKGGTNRWIRVVHEFKTHLTDGIIAFRIEELDGTLIDEVRFEGQTSWAQYGFYMKLGGMYHGAGTNYRRNIRVERKAT